MNITELIQHIDSIKYDPNSYNDNIALYLIVMELIIFIVVIIYLMKIVSDDYTTMYDDYDYDYDYNIYNNMRFYIKDKSAKIKGYIRRKFLKYAIDNNFKLKASPFIPIVNKNIKPIEEFNLYTGKPVKIEVEDGYSTAINRDTIK